MPSPEDSELAKARSQTGPTSTRCGCHRRTDLCLLAHAGATNRHPPAERQFWDAGSARPDLVEELASICTDCRQFSRRSMARREGRACWRRQKMRAGRIWRRARFTDWRGSVGSKTWRNLRFPKLPAKYFLAFIALGLAAFIGFVLYSIATLPITGGLQVEATQSALTFEGSQGEVFAARGVFKGDRLTAADMPPHLAQAIVAIEDRRFYRTPRCRYQGNIARGLAEFPGRQHA